VKRRDQQLAASAMLFVLQSERRARTQHQVESSTLRTTSVRVWKNCFTSAGSLMITVGPKNGSLTVNAVP
jgi:hypothetical protein